MLAHGFAPAPLAGLVRIGLIARTTEPVIGGRANVRSQKSSSGPAGSSITDDSRLATTDRGREKVAIIDKNAKALPENIVEFNAIAGLAFAQLYKEFPARVDISREAIADAMGISSDLLPSGRSFSQILVFTLSWLQDEGYISPLNVATYASWQKLVLSEKGLRALNAVPPSLGEPVGSHLRNLSDQPSEGPSRVSQIADAVGSFIGGFTKSMSGP